MDLGLDQPFAEMEGDSKASPLGSAERTALLPSRETTALREGLARCPVDLPQGTTARLRHARRPYVDEFRTAVIELAAAA